jgi:FdhD protein
MRGGRKRARRGLPAYISQSMHDSSRVTSIGEAVWSLVVNDELYLAGTASPGNERALGVGRLVAEGLIGGPADLLSIGTTALPNGSVRIEASIDPRPFAAGRDLRQHQAAEGCGLLHFLRCAPQLLARSRQTEAVDPGIVAPMLHELFEACRRTAPGGGVHAAGLSSGGDLHDIMVDVARHAAAEKAVGSVCLAKGLPLGGGLVVTARVSGSMALLAARAGVCWIASRSIPTTLAVDIAAVAGMTLVARAAGGEAQVIAPPTPAHE